MVQAGFLASTALMGVLTAAVVIALVNGREWRHYTPASLPTTPGDARSVGDSPGIWAVGFLLLVFVVGGTVVLLIGGFGTLGGVSAPAVDPGVAVGALLALLLAGYATAGSYATARSHGAGTAQAAMVGIWALGLLFVLAVALQLFLG